MDQKELEVNIAVLESLGWFIAEDEADPDAAEFDHLLKCCRPDGTPIEEVPVTSFLLAYYDEEDGGLEARLWFFAPKYSTSQDNIVALIEQDSRAFEWKTQRYHYNDFWYYDAEITQLGWTDEGECSVIKRTGALELISSAALALSVAYLRINGVKIARNGVFYEGNHSR